MYHGVQVLVFLHPLEKIGFERTTSNGALASRGFFCDELPVLGREVAVAEPELCMELLHSGLFFGQLGGSANSPLIRRLVTHRNWMKRGRST